MGPHLIIIAGVLRQNAPKVLFVEHDHMISTLTSCRPDQAFEVTILPGRPIGRRSVPDAHRPNAGLERGAERSVIVSNEILWRLVPWERLSDLARQPLRRRIAGHRKPQQLPPFVAENKKCKEQLKRNRRHHEQIDRRNALGMIVDEGLPGLQRTTLAGHHGDRNRRLGDADTELEQLAMHLGGAPQRVLKAHPSDQIAHLLGNARTASRRPGFPSPISRKTPAMPAHHRLGSDLNKTFSTWNTGGCRWHTAMNLPSGCPASP